MKRGYGLITKSVAVIAALLIGAVPAVAYAQTDAATQPQATKTLAQRLAERKAALKTKLTTAQMTRLKGRCKAAQVVLNNYKDRVGTVAKNRINAYDTVTDHLNVLITKIDDQVDTSALKNEVTELKNKITTFDTDTTSYQQTISDLAEMDCVSDPTSFKASLEAAKSQQTALKTESAAIRTYLQDTVKPTLQKIRTDLSSKQGEVIN